MNYLEARRRYLRMVILVLAAAVFAGADVNAKTIVTTYSYNRDGALTAVTTHSEGQIPSTIYITWDNFRPETKEPALGTVAAADGRMIGFGAASGAGSLTARFSFDARDRLLGYSGEAGAETYDYHAGGMLLSSSLSDDVRYFYQDTTANPAVTNSYHSGLDLWSAYLGNSRFVNDGSAQVLLRPRKDIAASYDPDSRTMQSYVFDAFGSRTDVESPAGGYDLHDNPLGYAGEYRDPVWGGIYLRARWYHPDLPVFLSRDPRPHLNRFAYGGGNPVMNVDPSGYSANFWKKTEGFLRRADKMLNRGVGGHFARIFLAPLLGPLQIAANPRQFWEAVETNKSYIDVFLAVGVLSEVAGGWYDAAYAGYGVRLGKRFGARMLSDIVIGGLQSIAAAAHHGSSGFDWNVFGQGLEYSASPFVWRGLAGFNVRSGFRLSADDVAGMAETLRNADDTALIFRRKISLEKLASRNRGHDFRFSMNKPFQEATHLGLYHESLIAVTKNQIFTSDVVDQGLMIYESKQLTLDTIKRSLKDIKGKFEFVGRVGDFSTADGWRTFLSNPLSFCIASNETTQLAHEIQIGRVLPTAYNPFRNNCHHHVYAVLKYMGLR